MVYPTFRAGPLAVLERQFLFAAHDMATSVAGLRRIPRVDGDKVLAVQCCLISQHTKEHPPAIVLDAHSQGMVLQQVPAPQFFCCDQIVVLDQCRGSAVQEIFAALHDLLQARCGPSVGGAVGDTSYAEAWQLAKHGRNRAECIEQAMSQPTNRKPCQAAT